MRSEERAVVLSALRNTDNAINRLLTLDNVMIQDRSVITALNNLENAAHLLGIALEDAESEQELDFNNLTLDEGDEWDFD